MPRFRRSIWETLAEESTEGPTVTVSLPRELAQQLAGVLMGSLEMDGSGVGDEDDPPTGHREPDEDDFGGEPDGDADDADPLAALMGAGDDSDDDDDTDEAPRPRTALGERRGRR